MREGREYEDYASAARVATLCRVAGVFVAIPCSKSVIFLDKDTGLVMTILDGGIKIAS